MSVLNPNHPVSAFMGDQWHKIVAVLAHKAGGEIVITAADLEQLPDNACLAVDSSGDVLRFTVMDTETGAALARKEGGAAGMKGRILAAAADAERAEFVFYFEDRGCSCHIVAPCSYCTHPGNPGNQAEDETAWEPCPDCGGAGVVEVSGPVLPMCCGIASATTCCGQPLMLRPVDTCPRCAHG